MAYDFTYAKPLDRQEALAQEPVAVQDPSTVERSERLAELGGNLEAAASDMGEYQGSEDLQLPVLETIKRWHMSKFGARE